MIKIIVATPKGELINKEVESIVVSGDTGQIGILMNRLPLLTKITKGFIKVNSSDVEYIAAHPMPGKEVFFPMNLFPVFLTICCRE